MAAILEKTKEKLTGIFTKDNTSEEVPINTPDQQTLYDNVMMDYSVFKAAKQGVIPLWQEEYRIWAGNHWDGLRSRTVTEKYRPNSTDNIAWAQCESIVGKLTGWDPWPDFQAQEEGDEQKANDLNDFVPHELRQIKFKQKYIRAVRQMVIHGPIILKTIFDPNVEGGRGQNRFVGRNDIVPVELGSFFPDPRVTDFIYLQDMAAIIINTRRTLEYFRQRWPEQGPKVKPDSQAGDVQIFNYDNAGAQQRSFSFTDATFPYDSSTQDKTAGLIEYWYRGLPKMMTKEDKDLFQEEAADKLTKGIDPSESLAKSEGRMEGVHCVYVSTSGVFLEHKAYVYDHGMYPFTARTIFTDSRNLWGKGFMRDMVRPQIMLNKFVELAIESMATQGNGGIMYESQAIRKVNTWKEQRSRPGAMLPVENGQIGNVKELKGADIPPYIVQMIDYYLNILQKIPGQFDSSNGAANPNVTSGEQAKALISASSTRLNPVTDAIQEALQDVFTQYIELIAQFYTTQRIARVTGRQVAIGRDQLVNRVPTQFQQTTEDGSEALIDVQEEYVPTFDIYVNISAEKPTDREYYIQMAFNLLQMVDPVTQMPIIDGQAVRYTVDNGRMEPFSVINQRLSREMMIKQTIEGLEQQNQQLQMQMQSVMQQLGMAQEENLSAERDVMKLQQDQQKENANWAIQNRKLDIEEMKARKTANMV